MIYVLKILFTESKTKNVIEQLIIYFYLVASRLSKESILPWRSLQWTRSSKHRWFSGIYSFLVVGLLDGNLKELLFMFLEILFGDMSCTVTSSLMSTSLFLIFIINRQFLLSSRTTTILDFLEYYLRNKSWKPECVLSFSMGWRILVNSIPHLCLGINY